MGKNIRSILIANRGEIAVRVIRACRESGIRSVAVYSDADAGSLHARLADEAYRIGPPASADSYLRGEIIIETAKKANCDAIHPGYGFLSENAGFAAMVEQSGLVFIGPPSTAIRAMGDKTEARKLMQRSGVPTVPGTESAIASEEEALATAEKIGYPVLIKAAAGGGGKGMRIVQKAEDLPGAMRSSANEARSAFGDERVYIEKYLENPRHIEFQILADAHGHIVYLGERECSIQRRHQKVVEETPSAIVTGEMRRSMGAAAVEAGRACGYVNAGTVEFLVDRRRNFYFLEMNTRLQVEHPVTEMVTGIDLVKQQIRIAAGEPLPFTQEDIHPRGHAIECRLCAEDVFNNFLPSIGRIDAYAPSRGFGIRDDSGIEQGGAIERWYDPMFGKLIAWGQDRAEAIERMKRALGEYRISGIETTIPFCLFVMEHPKFVEGDFDTHFVPQYFRPELLAPPAETARAAALAAVLLLRDKRGAAAPELSSNGAAPSRWLFHGRRDAIR